MLDYIEWLRVFILQYSSFQYLIIFLVTMLGGELALFTLAFLVAQGVFFLSPLIIFGFFGAFSPNILWFLLGRTNTTEKIISHRYANKTTSIIVEAITRTSHGSDLMALIITKFLICTPFILMIYVSKTALSFKKFLFCESIAILFSLLIIIPIGFASGLGFNYLAENLQNLYAALGFILLVIIIITMAQIWFKKRFTKAI